MATSKADVKANYPLPVYNYKVDIGQTTVAFSEVSGLNLAYETTTYKESSTEAGKVSPKVFRMPAQAVTTTLTLKKGLVPAKNKAALFDWISTISLNQVEKEDIVISLCDETGTAVVTWTVTNAFPTKLDVPTFDANSNDVAIESMELMADDVLINYKP
jgi:phage tail-like protein